MALSKEDILGLSDVEVKLIKVPDWKVGGEPAEVYIRTISGAERSKIEDLSIKKQYENLKIKCVVCFLSNEQGVPLFTQGDVPALSKKSAAALNYIFDEGTTFNKMNPDDVEDAEKN